MLAWYGVWGILNAPRPPFMVKVSLLCLCGVMVDAGLALLRRHAPGFLSGGMPRQIIEAPPTIGAHP